MAPFFLDRSLRRVQLPQLLRDDGWELHTLAEVFGVPKDETVSDVEWLELSSRISRGSTRKRSSRGLHCSQ